MKISKEAKTKTKEKILASAVDLIIKKGFKNASMREMAKNSDVSNPTIYNYFPTKEKIIYEYFKQKHKQSADVLKKIDDFQTYSLREQLQTLIETELEFYLEDREFLLQISDMVISSSSLKIELLYETKELFIEMVQNMLEIAIEAGEIEDQPFKEYLPLLFWDYYISIVAYWLKDESEGFENTTEFIDHSMAVIESLLASNILSKVSDLGMFLFKTHVLSSLERFSTKGNKFKGIKKKFGEFINAN
jgi:AcrR family transcriptional regulator